MKIPFYLETERLILRDLRVTDIHGLFELDSNPIVHQYLGNNPIKEKSEATAYIENTRQQYSERGIGRWALVHKETNAFMGWSGLRFYTNQEVFNGQTNFYDVGYRLLPQFWGKGYVTEVVVNEVLMLGK